MAPDDPADLADRRPGEEPVDPYGSIDLATLPGWWRDAVDEFARRGLRPYRPPRFADGRLQHRVVAGLEAAHGVSVRFVGHVAHGEVTWTVEVDGEPIGTVERERIPEGYSRIDMASDAFVSWVEAAIEG